MPLIVKLESSEDQKWLITRLETALDRAKQNHFAYPEYIIQVERILDAVKNAGSIKTTSELIPPKKTGKEKPKKLKDLPGPCKVHPNRQAKYAPRDDCPTCWEAFGRLNPLKAKMARAKFDRKRRD